MARASPSTSTSAFIVPLVSLGGGGARTSSHVWRSRPFEKEFSSSCASACHANSSRNVFAIRFVFDVCRRVDRQSPLSYVASSCLCDDEGMRGTTTKGARCLKSESRRESRDSRERSRECEGEVCCARGIANRAPRTRATGSFWKKKAREGLYDSRSLSRVRRKTRDSEKFFRAERRELRSLPFFSLRRSTGTESPLIIRVRGEPFFFFFFRKVMFARGIVVFQHRSVNLVKSLLESHGLGTK